MHGQPQGCHRSVDRGTCRQGIELRNNRDWSADVVPHGGRQYRQVCYRKHLADSAQSETPGMHGNSTRENRETPLAPAADEAMGRLEKAMSQEPNMYADGESDGCVVCAEQRVDREGSSPSGARMRSVVSERGGNASRA